LTTTRSHPLDVVLRASSLAIVGASRDATKRGHHVVRSLLEGRYTGAIYPVHPAGGELFGLRVWRALDEIDGKPELALICTPAATVAALIEACGRKPVPAAVVLAVGFGETDAAGAQLEAELRAAVVRTCVRVVGPNTSGIMNATTGGGHGALCADTLYAQNAPLASFATRRARGCKRCSETPPLSTTPSASPARRTAHPPCSRMPCKSCSTTTPSAR
jgi:predicted CoA-binding protein